jgi:hypothetical protein
MPAPSVAWRLGATAMSTTAARHQVQETLPDYAQAYYVSLIAEFRSLAPTSDDPKTREQAEGLTRLESPTWQDVATLERLLLRLLTEEPLRRRAWLVRDRYRAIAGEEQYARYEQSQPPDAAQGPVEALREDLEALLGEIHYLYCMRSQQESLRAHVSARVGRLTAMVTAMAMVLLLAGLIEDYYQHHKKHPPASSASRTTAAADRNTNGGARPSASPGAVPGSTTGTGGGSPANSAKLATAGSTPLTGTAPENHPPAAPEDKASPASHGNTDFFDPMPLLVFILLFGALGGFVSVYRRVQSLAEPSRDTAGHRTPMLSLIELEHGRRSIMLAPVFGAVFAVVLYLVLAAGFLKGALFPQFTALPSDPKQGVTFIDFFNASSPVGLEDVARVLVWSFLAGFAERLVPDTLDRLTNQKEKQ